MVRVRNIGAEIGLNLRQSGIPLLDPLPWGTHICLFYETRQDLIEANMSFFRAGLASKELCLWILPDEIDRDSALAALRERVTGLDDHLAAGAIELVSEREWYHRSEPFDFAKALNSLHARLEAARSHGFEGMRASANAFWMDGKLWPIFREYEEELTELLSGREMLVLCTYKLSESSAVDILNIARIHQFSIFLREGRWETLQTPWMAARQRAGAAATAIELPARPFTGHERLTPRERATLTQIVAGASNKEAARALGISPRTIEFHRANIMRKLNAGSLAELIATVLADGSGR
jgi:DNA-binding CsgD family transcriptional regulator